MGWGGGERPSYQATASETRVFYLFNVKDPVVNVGDARGPGGRHDVPEVQRLFVGIGDGDIYHLAHVILKEQAAAILVVVDQIF